MLKKIIHVVAAAMYNEKEEVFCALRSQKMSLPGLWEFPGGKFTYILGPLFKSYLQI